MATLSFHGTTDVLLTLRGADEDRILEAVRRWPYWTSAKVTRDPANARRCLAVRLTTNREYERMLREILHRGFGLKFPVEGGESVAGPVPLSAKPKRRR
jgi:hypothetical protein